MGGVGAKGLFKQESSKEQSQPRMYQAEMNSWILGATASVEAAGGTGWTLDLCRQELSKVFPPPEMAWSVGFAVRGAEWATPVPWLL